VTTTPLTDQQLADTISEALAEMHTAIEGIVRLFQQRCPEGFDASDVAAAIVDACSDELGPLYRDRAELGRVRAELATAKGRINAVLALDFADREQLEQMDPEQYHHADGYGDAIWAVQMILTDPAAPAAAVPSA
jgi:hypothetical protein